MFIASTVQVAGMPIVLRCRAGPGTGRTQRRRLRLRCYAIRTTRSRAATALLRTGGFSFLPTAGIRWRDKRWIYRIGIRKSSAKTSYLLRFRRTQYLKPEAPTYLKTIGTALPRSQTSNYNFCQSFLLLLVADDTAKCPGQHLDNIILRQRNEGLWRRLPLHGIILTQ